MSETGAAAVQVAPYMADATTGVGLVEADQLKGLRYTGRVVVQLIAAPILGLALLVCLPVLGILALMLQAVQAVLPRGEPGSRRLRATKA